MRLGRREFLVGAGATALGAGLGVGQMRAQAGVPLDIRSRVTSYGFERPATQGLISLADNAPPPVIRLRQGVPATINFTNGLTDYTTMHWHGLRIPNGMDGVPYLTQLPIAGDETYQYSFTPPDAGSFWYHPHCLTMEQMALGLTGLLIVEEEAAPGFDADLPLNLKGFRLDEEGALLPFFTPRGAARGGTQPNLLTTNWQLNPVETAPAGGLIRLRIAATDTTRVYKLVFPDLPGEIIAWDGHPVDEPIPWPTLEAPLWLAPGQRVDVALRMPSQEGAEAVFHTLVGYQPTPIVTLRAEGADLGRDLAELSPLPRNPIAEPDLAHAEAHELLFGWTPEGGVVRNGLCGSYEYSFWSINRAPWPGDAVPGVAPVVEMQQGQSYILRLRNESPNLHPIHLHGLVFKPIRSNQRHLPANYTDTVLLLENEVMDVALRADNPGDWAFHCHVIEHQKTGLSGFVRVV